MVSEWDQYSVHQDMDPEVIKQKTVEAENMVHKMRKMDLPPSKPIAMDESTKAQECEFRRSCVRSAIWGGQLWKGGTGKAPGGRVVYHGGPAEVILLQAWELCTAAPFVIGWVSQGFCVWVYIRKFP